MVTQNDFPVYRKVFLVFNFDKACIFWIQIRHKMSSRSDISGQYFPDYDFSIQATRNAFRESLEMQFLVKIFPLNYLIQKSSLGVLAENSKKLWDDGKHVNFGYFSHELRRGRA